MKILLVGCAAEAAPFLKALLYSHEHEIIHCADGSHAIAELHGNGKKYDWAILDGRAMMEGEKDIARIIRAMDPSFCPGHEERAQTSPPVIHSPAATCGVEWSKDGVLQLHCGLHTLLKGAGAPPRAGMECAGEILFEYHAPCHKGRRRNG